MRAIVGVIGIDLYDHNFDYSETVVDECIGSAIEVLLANKHAWQQLDMDYFK